MDSSTYTYAQSSYGTRYSTPATTETQLHRPQRARADHYDLFLLIQDMLRSDERAILEFPIDEWGRDDAWSFSLGAGGFSSVSRRIAKSRWGNRSVMAYKRIRPVFTYDGEVDDGAALAQFIDEVKALAAPELRSHPNINRLRGVSFETQSHRPDGTLFPVLISDPSPLGNLLQFIQDPVRIVEGPFWECCLDVARGLQALHNNMCIHGDVKCENVLVFPSAGLEGRKFVAKLTDFGCSMALDAIEPYTYTRMRGATPPYDAPESDSMIQRELLPFTDVYSYGLLVWRVAIDGADPFNHHRYRSSTGEGAASINHAAIREDKYNEATLSLALSAIYDTVLGLEAATADSLGEVLTIALSADPAERSLTRVSDIFERRKSFFERRLFGLTPTAGRYLREFIKHDTGEMRELAHSQYGVAAWSRIPPRAHHFYHITHKYGSIDGDFRGFGLSRLSPLADCVREVLLAIENVYISCGRPAPSIGHRDPMPSSDAGPNLDGAVNSVLAVSTTGILEAVEVAGTCRDERLFTQLTDRLQASIQGFRQVAHFMGAFLGSVSGPKRAPTPNTLQTFNQTLATSTHGLYDRPDGLAATDTIVMTNEDSPKPLSGGFKPSSSLDFHLLSTCQLPVVLQEQLFRDVSSRARQANTIDFQVVAMEEAICYSIGFGVKQDHARSLTIIKECCGLGYGPAQEALLRLHDALGFPVPADVLAAPWYKIREEGQEDALSTSATAAEEVVDGPAKSLRGLGELSISDTPPHGDTMVIAACRAGNLGLVHALLNEGIDCRATNSFGESALHWVWKLDATSIRSIVPRLIHSGADPNAVAREHPSSTPHGPYPLVEGTALHRAVAQGNKTAVSELIRHGASANLAAGPVFFHNGHSQHLDPVQLACTWHDADIIETLLDANPLYPVNADKSGGLGLLHFVIQCQSTAERMARHGSNQPFALQATIDLLLSLGCTNKVASDGLTVLQQAVGGDSLDVLEYVTEIDTFMENIDEIVAGKSALHRAIASGNRDKFELLIRHGANVLQRPTVSNVLDFAIKLAPGKHYFVKRILDLGGQAITQHDKNHALVASLKESQWDLADYLLGIGANVNGFSCNHQSAMNTRFTVFGDVLSGGNTTGILQALDIILPLAEKHGQQPEFIVAPDLHQSALHVTAGKIIFHDKDEAARIYKTLLTMFPEPEHLEARESRGYSALHMAISTRNAVAVRALIDAGADVNSMALIEGSPAGPSTKDLVFAQIFSRESVYKLDVDVRNAGDRALEQIFRIYREDCRARAAKRSTTLRAQQRPYASARDRRVMAFVEVLSLLPESLKHDDLEIMGRMITAMAVGEDKQFLRDIDLGIQEIARLVQWSGIEMVRFLRYQGRDRLRHLGIWDDYIDD
ncbi:hypothetical protein BDV12DRAFT_196842 [Aspergillus spectabilis]